MGKKEQVFYDIANILRRDVLLMTNKAGSGHPTSCFSCAEILSVLYFDQLRIDVKKPLSKNNDEFVLSKGHAAPILYSVLYRAGAIKTNLGTLRKFTSKLEGHPMPRSLSWAKVASGSLGQGLSVGVGMALARPKTKVYVLLGDSEMAEGSNYEAMQLASHYNRNNICAIVDANRLGQRGATMVGHAVNVHKKRFEAFGWDTIVIDGHDVKQIIQAFKQFNQAKKPFAIIAKTVKGKGLKFLENKNGWHGKALGDELVQAALTEIPNPKFPNVKVKKPINDTLKKINLKRLNLPEFKVDDEIATREAYGLGLLNLAEHDPNIMVLDAEVSNSTHAETVKKKHPEQFIECYIAEQNMVGVGQGLAVCGYTVFMSTFAAFLTRAHDQIRMAALSNSKFIVCGSHCGVSIGEDGASQMGLEDIALFRALPNSVVLYPADAVATLKLMELATKQTGITYIRTTRPKVPVIYANNEKFLLGGFKAVKQTTKDKVVLVGAGITLYEALKAYELLAAKGVAVAVVDLYCVKPFDHTKFKQFVRRHGGKVVVVEDHRPEGGIGEMIAAGLVDEEFVVEKLAIDTIPHSGTKDELLNKYGIGAKHIVEAALRSLKRKR